MQNVYLVKNVTFSLPPKTLKSIQESWNKDKEATRKPGEYFGLDPTKHSDKCLSLSMWILQLEPMNNSTSYVWLFAAWENEGGRNLIVSSWLQSWLVSWLRTTSGHRYSLIYNISILYFHCLNLKNFIWQFTSDNTVFSHWRNRIEETEEMT